MSVPEMRMSRLENGTTLLEQSTSTLKRFTIVVGIPAGECHDPLGKSGLSHLSEHVFSGKEGGMDRFGAELVKRRLEGNAANGEDLTWFYITGKRNSQVPEALALLASSLRSPPTDPELLVHKKIVRSELLNYSGRHDRQIVWGTGCVFARPESDLLRANLCDLEKIGLDDILEFQNTYVKGQSLYIAATGCVPQDFAMHVESQFGSLPSNGVHLPTYTKPTLPTPFSRYFVFGSQAGVSDVGLCYDLPVIRDPKQEAVMRVLTAAIGGDETGLLVRQLRGEIGVAYSPSATFDRNSLAGDKIDIGFYCSSDDLRTAAHTLQGVIQSIREKELSKEALKLAKLEAKSDLRAAMTEDGRGIMMIEHALWGRALPTELATYIGRVSSEEVYQAANHALNGNHATVLVGPKDAEGYLNELHFH